MKKRILLVLVLLIILSSFVSASIFTGVWEDYLTGKAFGSSVLRSSTRQAGQHCNYFFKCGTGLKCVNGRCQATTTITPFFSRCTDSDGGRNYYVKGRTVGKYPPQIQNQELRDYYDICAKDDPGWEDLGGNILFEYSCRDGYFDDESYTCPNGCKDGACIQTIPIPNETKQFIKTSDIGLFTYICPAPCPYSQSLFLAKLNGLEKGFSQLYALTNLTPLKEYTPIFYLSNGNNSFCMSAEEMLSRFGFLTGYPIIINGKGVICCYDYEKDNRARSIPFDVANAGRIQDQELAIHEMGHIIFFGRTSISYNIQESFVKAQAYKIAGVCDGNGITNSNFKIPPTPCIEGLNDIAPNKLVYLLCKDYGLQWKHFANIYKKIEAKYKSSGNPVSDSEFKNIVDGVLGKNTSKAFNQVGINI